MESTSATWTPHIGSRTRRRPGESAEAFSVPATDSGCAGTEEPPPSIHATSRANMRMPQDRIKTQTTNRIIRTIKPIPPFPADPADSHGSSIPLKRLISSKGKCSVCKQKRASQTKRREFNKLRGLVRHAPDPASSPFGSKALVFNHVEWSNSQTACPNLLTRPATEFDQCPYMDATPRASRSSRQPAGNSL
jgi:hypothetical protein